MLENQKKLGAAKAASFNAISSKIPQSHHTTRYNEAMQIIWGTNHSRLETDNAYRFSRKSFNHGNASASFSRKTSGAQCTTALYEDVSDAFLKDYYSQVLCQLYMQLLFSRSVKGKQMFRVWHQCLCYFLALNRKRRMLWKGRTGFWSLTLRAMALLLARWAAAAFWGLIMTCSSSMTSARSSRLCLRSVPLLHQYPTLLWHKKYKVLSKQI